MKFALILMLCATAFAQTFTGGVAAMRFVPPGGVANIFLLFGEEAVPSANQFSYDATKFNLSFTDSTDAPLICSGGCTLAAAIEQWYTPQSIGGCTITSATLENGTYSQGAYYEKSGQRVPPKVFYNVTALFSQTYCVEGANHFYSGGTLTVNLK